MILKKFLTSIIVIQRLYVSIYFDYLQRIAFTVKVSPFRVQKFDKQIDSKRNYTNMTYA